MPKVILDSNVIISVLNSKDSLHAQADSAVRTWQERNAEFPLSTVVWSEVLTGTLLHRGEQGRKKLEEFRDGFFSTSVPIDMEIATVAAELRSNARPRLKVPDAMVLATGMQLSVDKVVTADAAMKKAAPDLVELVTA